MTTKPQVQPENSILSRLSEQLMLLERRDFEQWVIVVGTGILVEAGLVLILFPGASQSRPALEEAAQLSDDRRRPLPRNRLPFGHTTGDFLLLEVGTILKCAVRGSDAVIRFGGDEFLVILADAPMENVDVVKARIQRFVQDWNQIGHLKDFELAFSVGASAWAPAKTSDDFMNEADKEMYAVKAHVDAGPPAI